jgi:hypothetical protein
MGANAAIHMYSTHVYAMPIHCFTCLSFTSFVIQDTLEDEAQSGDHESDS